MRVKLWAGCPCRFRWRSWAAARGKRRDGFWKRSHGGRKRITTRLKFHLRRWQRWRKNLGRSIWSASSGTNSRTWKGCELSRKGAKYGTIFWCCSWAARLAISLATRRQTVHVPAANLRLMLDEDVTICTESSHKYHAEEFPDRAARKGFRGA